MRYDREKVNKRVAFYRVSKNLEELSKSGRTFESIFNISFKKDGYTLFETVNNAGVKKISYGEAKENVTKFAKYFSKHLSKDNVYVGIYLENSPDWIYSFYGLLMSGFIPVLLSTRSDDKELYSVIKRLKIHHIISNKTFENIDTILLTSIKSNTEVNDDFVARWANEIIFMTSGVTNEPKLVAFTGKEISYQMENSLSILKNNLLFASAYKGYLKHLMILPFYHIFGLIAVFLWFSFFNVAFVFPNNLKPDSIRQAAIMSRVTHIFAVPLFWNTLSKQIIKVVKSKNAEKKFNKAINFSIKLQKAFPKVGPRLVRNVLFKKYLSNIFGNSIAFCISGGGNISNETLKIINGLGYPLSNGYGATEIGITSLENSMNIMNRISGSVGYEFNTIHYRLDDKNGTTSLYVSGQSICNKVLVDGTWKKINENEEINTNDLVIKKDNGYFINGRLDNLYISNNGENYCLEKIESELKLTYCNDYSLIITNKNELVLVLSYPSSCVDLQIQKDIEDLKKDASLFKLIKNVYITNRIIPMANGIKIKRRQLLEDFNNYSNEFNDFDSYINHKNDMLNSEKCDDITNRIITIFKKHFSDTSITSNSNFYADLNGDSLLYFMLVADIEKEFNLTISMESNIPLTPHDFAELVKRNINS